MASFNDLIKAKRVSEDFEPVTIAFENESYDFLAKKELSTADFEFIFLNNEETTGVMARRIHRCVRLVEPVNGSDRISLDDAANLPSDLTISIITVINEVAPIDDAEDQDETEKK